MIAMCAKIYAISIDHNLLNAIKLRLNVIFFLHKNSFICKASQVRHVSSFIGGIQLRFCQMSIFADFIDRKDQDECRSIAF